MPTAKILMLTVSDDEDDLYEAIKAGAAGYLLKEISIEEVAERRSARGERAEPDLAVDGRKLLTEFTNLAKQGRGAAVGARAPPHRPGARGAASSWPRA